MARRFDELEPALRYRYKAPRDPSVDTFKERFAPFTDRPGEFMDYQKYLIEQEGEPVVPGRRERFLDETKVISESGKNGGQQPYRVAQAGGGYPPLPEGFTVDKGGDGYPPLPEGFSLDGPRGHANPLPSSAPGGEIRPAPQAGISQVPEDPSERAALRTQRSVMPPGGRQEGAITRGLEAAPGVVGGVAQEALGAMERGVKTGDLPPDEALQAALAANPASVAYRTGMGVAKAALSPMERAQREIGVMSVPRAAEAGPVGQAIANKLVDAPVGGGGIRRAAERSTDELNAAAARVSGDPAVAGAAIKESLIAAGEAAPPGLQRFAQITGSENVLRDMLRMAQSGKADDITTLAQLRKHIPAERRSEIQGGLIEQMGRGSSGSFEPRAWVEQYGQLSPRMRNVLFGEGSRSGTLRGHLDAIEEVSKRAHRWQQFERPGQPRAGLERKGAIMGSIGALGYMEPLTLLATVVPAAVIRMGLSGPATAASIAQYSRAYERLVRAPGAPQSVASFGIAVRNLNNTLGTNISVDDLKGGAGGLTLE